jgi:hypothetical protein
LGDVGGFLEVCIVGKRENEGGAGQPLMLD